MSHRPTPTHLGRPDRDRPDRRSSRPQSRRVGTFDGRPITRDDAHRLAADAGLTVKANVSKGLDVLVVADPDTQSGKATKARQLGTRVMAEPVFWQAIGAPLR